MEQQRSWLFLIAACLLVPALLINLGLQAFIDDESIRALVALEMKLSGNYITPTLHGEYYYNKPPLFNWILLAFFELTGRIDEFTARFVTVIALLGYAATIYAYARRHYDTKTALLQAFVFITCGRVLFWDSMLALIDITFSWTVFTSFMVIYHAFERERYWKLFLLSYFLTALAFLMKGLPAIVFQGITLLVYFTYRRRFGKLFSLPHVAGGLLFLSIVGGYYLIYHQYNSLETVFTTLFRESSKRTVINFGWWNTVGHIFVFPFEMIYHFLPWSLMILYVLRRDVLRLIRQDRFMTFSLLIFLANLVPYWTSPQVFPRYLLMLAPLLFSVFLHLHFIHRRENTWQYRFFNGFFGIVLLLIALGSFAPMFLERLAWIPNRAPKTMSIGLILLGLVWLYRRLAGERLVIIVLFLLAFRIEFDWFVLPDRNANDFGNICRITSRHAGEAYIGRDMYLYGAVEMQPTNSFYLTEERRRIITRKLDNFDKEAVYIINPAIAPGLRYDKLGEINVRHGQLTYDIGVLKNE